jgi:hypothetical protein
LGGIARATCAVQTVEAKNGAFLIVFLSPWRDSSRIGFSVATNPKETSMAICWFSCFVPLRVLFLRSDHQKCRQPWYSFAWDIQLFRLCDFHGRPAECNRRSCWLRRLCVPDVSVTFFDKTCRTSASGSKRKSWRLKVMSALARTAAIVRRDRQEGRVPLPPSLPIPRLAKHAGGIIH